MCLEVGFGIRGVLLPESY